MKEPLPNKHADKRTKAYKQWLTLRTAIYNANYNAVGTPEVVGYLRRQGVNGTEAERARMLLDEPGDFYGYAYRYAASNRQSLEAFIAEKRREAEVRERQAGERSYLDRYLNYG